MKLLTAELRSEIPSLYSQEEAKDATVHVKFFCPWSNWTWFATEGSEQEGDFLFFGYVIGHEEEWGYFLLSELESVRGRGGLTIERDLHFKTWTVRRGHRTISQRTRRMIYSRLPRFNSGSLFRLAAAL